MINRRTLLQLGAATGIGLQSGPILSKNQEKTSLSDSVPGIRAYNQLGRTGLNISDISFGSSQSSDPDLVRHALDRGVTYFDTAESYRCGTSEVAIGEGLGAIGAAAAGIAAESSLATALVFAALLSLASAVVAVPHPFVPAKVPSNTA